jgi:hypothetical protein
MVTKSDKEKYAELVATAYKKLMDIAEADPNAESYDEDEMEDL